MANKKISELDPASALGGTELVEVVQTNNKKLMLTALKDWILTFLPKQVLDFRIGYAGTLKPDDGEVPFKQAVGQASVLKEDLAECFATAEVAATASAVISILKNGTSVATMTFAASGTTATLSTQAEVSFLATDVLSIRMPATQDATLAGIQVRLLLEVI